MTGTAINRSRRQQQAGHAPARLLLMWLCLLLAAAMPHPPLAQAASTSLRVNARILPWLDLSVTPGITSFRVDDAAIQRGYIDLPNALRIRLATNLRREIDLNLISSGPERIVVADNGRPGSELLRIPALAGTQPVIRELDLRVVLPHNMKEGSYPLQLSVSALDI